VKETVNQNQFDALVDFTFNIGCGAFSSSTLLKKLNSGDHSGAAEEFLRWKFVKGVEVAGLLRRRKADRDLFLAL
jgi:GH24 family phage-related lysozyme (muramidase)